MLHLYYNLCSLYAQHVCYAATTKEKNKSQLILFKHWNKSSNWDAISIIYTVLCVGEFYGSQNHIAQLFIQFIRFLYWLVVCRRQIRIEIEFHEFMQTQCNITLYVQSEIQIIKIDFLEWERTKTHLFSTITNSIEVFVYWLCVRYTATNIYIFQIFIHSSTCVTFFFRKSLYTSNGHLYMSCTHNISIAFVWCDFFFHAHH